MRASPIFSSEPHNFLLLSYFTPKLQLFGYIVLEVLESTAKHLHIFVENIVIGFDLLEVL